MLLLRLYGEEPSLISSAVELFKVTGQQVVEPYSLSPAICSPCRLLADFLVSVSAVGGWRLFLFRDLHSLSVLLLGNS